MSNHRLKLAAAIIITAALVVYAAMVLVTLPHLASIAANNGLVDARPFDMQPMGYDFDSTRAFLKALGKEGRNEYLEVQQRLDTAFPLLNGLSLAIGLIWLGSTFNLPVIAARLLAIVLGAASAGFDWAENFAVAAMLQVGPDALTPSLVERANMFTMLKTIAVSTTMTLLLIGLIVVLVRRIMPKS